METTITTSFGTFQVKQNGNNVDLYQYGNKLIELKNTMWWDYDQLLNKIYEVENVLKQALESNQKYKELETIKALIDTHEEWCNKENKGFVVSRLKQIHNKLNQ